MDAEVWMMGTREQVAVLLVGIKSVTNVYYLGEEHKLTGEDTGRVRRYARVVPAARQAEEPPPKKRRTKRLQGDYSDTPLLEEGAA